MGAISVINVIPCYLLCNFRWHTAFLCQFLFQFLLNFLYYILTITVLKYCLTKERGHALFLPLGKCVVPLPLFSVPFHKQSQTVDLLCSTIAFPLEQQKCVYKSLAYYAAVLLLGRQERKKRTRWLNVASLWFPMCNSVISLCSWCLDRRFSLYFALLLSGILIRNWCSVVKLIFLISWLPNKQFISSVRCVS